MTRAGVALLRGDISTSVQHHPLFVVLLIQAVIFAALVRFGSTAITRRLRQELSRITYINLALLTSVWVLRMAIGDIPVPFGS